MQDGIARCFPFARDSRHAPGLEPFVESKDGRERISLSNFHITRKARRKGFSG